MRNEVATGSSSTFVSNRISWPSVFAGLMVAIALQVTLSLLPMSFGLVFLGPESPGGASSLSWATALFYILISAVALFFGAFIAARLTNIPRKSTGIIHGLIIWSLAVIVNVFLLGQSVMGITNQVGNAVKSLANIDMSIQKVLPQNFTEQLSQYNISLDDLKEEATTILQQTQNPNLSQNQIQQEAQQVQKIGKQALRDIAFSPQDIGQDIDELINQMVKATKDTWNSLSQRDIANVIMARSNLSQEEAMDVASRWKNEIDQAIQNLDARLQDARQAVVSRTDQAMDWLAGLAFFAFISLAVSALVAIWGGAVGTPHTNKL